MGERARVTMIDWLIDWSIDWLIDWYHHPILSLNRWLQFHVSIDWNDWVLRRGPSREKLCLFCARRSPHPFLFLSCWRLELFFLSFSFSFFPLLSLISSILFQCCFDAFFCFVCFLAFFLFSFSPFLSFRWSAPLYPSDVSMHLSRDILRRVSCESFDFRARLSFFLCVSAL